MAYEIELKAFLQNKDTIVKTLTNKGCIWKKEKKQYDKTYYKKESDYNDLFFRIRCEDDKNYTLTLKQILNSIEVIEYESTIGNPDAISNMIQQIGFEEYVTIKKIRVEGKLDDFSICLDEVADLGSFIEVEKIVEENSERENAKKEIREFLSAIGVNLDHICSKRYHTMIFELLRGEKK